MALNTSKCIRQRMGKSLFPLFIFIFCSYALLAQNVSPDVFGRSFDMDTNDPATMALALCKNYQSDHDKARVIFSWLAHHIRYDLEEARTNRPVQIMYRSQEDLERKLANIRNQSMQRALRLRKGVCHHYAILFQTMCESVGLRSGEIEGFVSLSPADMGRLPDRPNHVWNWVEIEGKKILLDVTYAAGMSDLSGRGFNMQYDPDWFDVSPEIMIQTHYAENSADQFLPEYLTKGGFARQPFFYTGSIRSALISWYPLSSDIWLDQKPLTVSLHFRKRPKGVYLIVDGTAQELPSDWNGNKVDIDIPKDNLKGIPLLVIGVEEEENVVSYLMAWRLKHFR